MSKDVKRMSLEQAESFTSDQVTQARFPTHHKAPHTDLSRCCAPLPRFSRGSSYPLSTNLSHQLKINTASDRHSTTFALLQLTKDIEAGFNQRKPPHRTVCVAIDLTAAFDTVSHDTLISKISGSSLPPAITQWLSCYLRGRQAATGSKDFGLLVAELSGNTQSPTNRDQLLS